MRKIISLLLILCVCTCFFACGENEFGFSVDKKIETAYHELGLYFKLPNDFIQRKVSYAEMYYSNSEASFMYDVYSNDAIEETLGYDADITVEEYTKKFIILNGFDMEYNYDPETNKSVIEYEHHYNEDEGIEDEYYFHLIMRGSSHLYIITMSCELDVYDEYAPKFRELIDIIYAE